VSGGEFYFHIALPNVEDLQVVRGRVTEGMSQRTTAVLEVASSELVDLGALLDENVVLTLVGREERRWSLMITEGAFLHELGGRWRYELVLRDALWSQTLTRDTRKFRGMSVREIVAHCLDQARVAHRFHLVQELGPRQYRVQYRESNLLFIERLLELEGIYYFFEDDGVLVLADDSTTAPTLELEEPLSLLESGDALTRGADGLHELMRRAQLRPGSITVSDYNWKNPGLPLRAEAVGDRDGDLPQYRIWAGFREPEEGARIARLRLEAERALARVVEGRSNVPGFKPAHRFPLAEVGGLSAGAYTLVEVEHEFAAGGFDDVADATYENRFTAIPEATPFRPPVVTPRPQVNGTHTAMVRGPVGEDIYTDEHGRFRVQMHWDQQALGNDEDSRWLRLLQEPTTSQALARTSWEMFVTYVDGDPERPFGLGRAMNALAAPSYALPGAKTRMTVKTPSTPASGGYSELSMDDAAEQQIVAFRAEKDLDIVVKNDRREIIRNNVTHTVGESFDHTVMGSQTVAVRHDAHATFGNEHMLEVAAHRSVKVGANESVTITDGQSIRVSQTDQETVGSLRMTTSGSFQVPDIGEMAKSAALTFAKGASPGAANLHGKVQTGQGLGQTAQSVIDDPEGYLTGQTQAQLDGLAAAGQGAATGAGTAAFESFGRDGSLGAAGETFESNLDGNLQSSIQGTLPGKPDFDGYYESIRSDFQSVVPTADTLKGAMTDGVNTLTGGLYGSLQSGDYRLALNQMIDLFTTGGIERHAPTAQVKLVGGCYVSSTLQDFSWTVGKAYTETVGGAKLTATPASISQSVEAPLAVNVGGALLRSSGTGTSVSAKATTIAVGALGDVSSPASIEVKGGDVVVEAIAGLALAAGGASLDMTPGSISISSDLSIDGQQVTISSSLADLK
jgi:type VI secretion system secreted protein VgrG